MKRLLALLMVAVLALGLSACGRKGPPEAPPDAKDEYPRKYPGV